MIERVREVVEFSNLSVAAFAGKIGANQVTFNQQLNGDRKLSLDTVIKILNAFDNVSSDWMLTGRGCMHKEQSEIQVLNHPKTHEKKIDGQDVALYDISAAANLRTLFDNKRQNILGTISIPNMPKCDGAVYVNGDSMYPLLKSGDIVAYKEVNDFKNVIYGEMYLVSFVLGEDDFLVVKYINRSEIEGCIKLVSYNTHHEPKDILLSSVRAMALVKLSIRKNTMI